MARNIEELKELINRKHAYDYEIARSLVSETSTEVLETALAIDEKRLPRFGDTVVTSACREEMETGPLVVLNNNPPEEETYWGKDYWSTQMWKDNGGNVWWYNDNGGDWISWLNLMACVRPIRDELADRYARESIHTNLGYVS